MPYIKAQKVKRDEEGRVVSGSAAIIDATYVPGPGHHVIKRVRERLGKVIELSEDGRSGVFRSPTRGLVRYDADTDEITPVERGDGSIKDDSIEFPEPQAHVVAGAVLLLLHILKDGGLLDVLRKTFAADADLERCVAHLLHALLSSAEVMGCDDFLSMTAASHLLPEVSAPSLASDDAYFRAMGTGEIKARFFTALVAEMRRRDASFGGCRYVDSMPMAYDTMPGSRLGLVLDATQGIPVWYELVPGNLLDHLTLDTLCEDVSSTLGITIDRAILDATYVTQELVCGTMPYLARMPAKRGFPTRRSLYARVRSQLKEEGHALVHDGHAFFGCHLMQEVLGTQSHCYVFLDKDKAIDRQRALMEEDPDSWAAMSAEDRDWERAKGGLLTLISNMDELTPQEAIDEYLGHREVESFLKTPKDCLDLLPAEKWTEAAVRGKVLHDAICTVALLEVRRAIAVAGKPWSPQALFGKASSVMCMRSGSSLVLETPRRQAREWCEALGYRLSARVDVASYRRDMLDIGK